MNFLSIDYFMMTAHERSFTRAAEKLHITQQTLSTSIANLEQELGCRLFERKIPLELTYGGQVFLDYARNVQKDKEEMEHRFSDIRQNHSGILRVGISVMRSRILMPQIIERFQRLHPNVFVRLIESSNEQMITRLQNRECDLVIGNIPQVSDIQLIDYYEEEIVLLIPNDLLEKHFHADPETVAQSIGEEPAVLKDFPFIMSSVPNIAGRVGYEILSGISAAPVVRCLSDNTETTLYMCLRGMGACFFPQNLAYAALTREQWKRLTAVHFDEVARYKIRFGIRKQGYQWSVLSDFIDCAGEVVGLAR